MSANCPLWIAYLCCLCSLGVIAPRQARSEDAPFSGPQVGEQLPPFKVQGAIGKMAGMEFDVIEHAAGKPLLLIFFHARTRPAFGLSKTITEYAATKSRAGLMTCVVFLTDDPTGTEKWLNIVEKNMPAGVLYGISHDGQEGPGAYGLNRNVTLTVLVGKEGKVTANLALIQPQLQADGPKILQAIADVTGGGKVPAIEDLEGDPYAARRRMDTQPVAERMNDAKLTTLLRGLINKQATPEQVSQSAAEIEKYIEENPTARKEIGRISTTIVDAGKLANYGTEAAQAVLRDWSKKYGDKSKSPSSPKPDAGN